MCGQEKQEKLAALIQLVCPVLSICAANVSWKMIIEHLKGYTYLNQLAIPCGSDSTL
jgi:hypothetical protein